MLLGYACLPGSKLLNMLPHVQVPLFRFVDSTHEVPLPNLRIFLLVRQFSSHVPVLLIMLIFLALQVTK